MELDTLFVNRSFPTKPASGNKKEQVSFEREFVKIVWKNLFRIEGN